MIITQGEVVDRQTVLRIELEDEDLDKYLDRGFKRVAPRTVIPGFRKGKAPRRVVEQFLGRESLINEVLDTLLPEVTSHAIAEQEIDAAGLPHVELVETEPFTLQATVPLTPEVDLGSYRDIRVSKNAVEFNQEDVEQRLEQLQHSMASWEPVERAAQMGDMVTMDLVGKVQGRTVLEEKDAVFFLDEDGTRPFPGFAKHLVGLAKDEPGDFQMSIPEDFSGRSLAGKEAVFSVTVSEIKKRILPAIDDEFAKSLADSRESLDVLRQEIEKELKAEAEQRVDQEYNESAVNALIQGATIELSPVMVEHEIEHMEEDQARVFERVNVRMDDYLKSIGKTEEEVKGEMGNAAVERLHRTFALFKLAELEGLEISDEEVEEKIQSLLADSDERAQSSEPQEISDDQRGSVRRMLLADKTVERLSAIALGEAPPLPEPEDGPAEEPPSDEEDSAEQGEEPDETKA